MTAFSSPFIALKHRNYRLYASGLLFSMVGTWMQSIALPWVAYRLTGSPLLLSLVGALQFLPVLLFSLPAGVLLDRLPLKKLLITLQIAALMITLGLAILAFSGHLQYWHILIFSTLQGFINTLDMPGRQTFTVELVGQKDLMSAIALNSTIFNLSRVLGPAVAGVLLATLGAAQCFLFNALSYAVFVLAIFFVKPLGVLAAKASAARRGLTAAIQDIRQGLSYIRSDKILVEALILIAIVGTFVPNFGVSVPVFTDEILAGGEGTFGYLMAILGFGSLLGAIYIAAASKNGPNPRILRIFPWIISLLMVISGFTSTFALSALALALTGFFFVSFTSTLNATLQLQSDVAYRGRVMSVYSLIFGGSTPIGNLYTGWSIEAFGARMGFIACGVAMILLLLIKPRPALT